MKANSSNKILKASVLMIFAFASISLSSTIISAASTWTVAPSPAGSGVASMSCAAPSFNTISAAITAASPGDTINVCAGTYSESQLDINKPLTIQGAGASTTIIDGGDATLATEGLIRITATGDVVFSGFTVRNAGGPTNGGDGGDNLDNYAIWMLETSSSSATYTITNNKIYGRNVEADYSDWGVYAINGGLENLVFTYNTVSQTGNNNVVIERVTGSTDISHNTLDAGDWGTTAIFYMTHDDTDITTLQKVSFNTINMSSGGPFDPDHGCSAISFSGSFRNSYAPNDDLGNGKYTNVEITGNNIINVQSYRRGIALADMDPTGSDGSIVNAKIFGNTISATSVGASTIGIRLVGLLTNADIEQNSISFMSKGVYGENALDFAPLATDYPTGTKLENNNIFGNAIGVQWDGTSAFDAIDNWWGSQTGPNNPTTNPSGIGNGVSNNVNYDPWLCQPYPPAVPSVNRMCISITPQKLTIFIVKKAALICDSGKSAPPSQGPPEIGGCVDVLAQDQSLLGTATDARFNEYLFDGEQLAELVVARDTDGAQFLNSLGNLFVNGTSKTLCTDVTNSNYQTGALWYGHDVSLLLATLPPSGGFNPSFDKIYQCVWTVAPQSFDNGLNRVSAQIGDIEGDIANTTSQFWYLNPAISISISFDSGSSIQFPAAQVGQTVFSTNTLLIKNTAAGGVDLAVYLTGNNLMDTSGIGLCPTSNFLDASNIGYRCKVGTYMSETFTPLSHLKEANTCRDLSARQCLVQDGWTKHNDLLPDASSAFTSILYNQHTAECWFDLTVPFPCLGTYSSANAIDVLVRAI